jgi:hypothetical protein
MREGDDERMEDWNTGILRADEQGTGQGRLTPVDFRSAPIVTKNSEKNFA